MWKIILATAILSSVATVHLLKSDETLSQLENTSFQSVAPDGYVFERVEYINDNPKMSFVFYKSREELRKYAPSGVKRDTLVAYTTTWKNSNKCVIHIVDPTLSYEPQYLGHEVLHCLVGNWHPSVNDSE